MPLTKPNQELRRDLKEIAALLKWPGVDLAGMAVRQPGGAGLRMAHAS